MSKINVGVIGSGYMGRLHAQKYSLMKDIKLIGIVDKDKSRAFEIANEFGTSYYVEYEELFGNVDAVSIATPTDTHFEIAKNCLEQNIHVLLEKPISENLCQAEKLIKISQHNSLIMQIGHIEQFNPAIVAIKDKINNLLFFESDRLGVFNNRSAKISVVLDLMIHDIELALSFIKADVESVHAIGRSIISSNIDIAHVYLLFTNNTTASMKVSRTENENKRKINFLQKDSYISLDLMNYSATLLDRREYAQESTFQNIFGKKLNINKNDQLNEQLKSFINSIRTLQQPIVTGRIAKKALEVALLIEKKIKHKL